MGHVKMIQWLPSDRGCIFADWSDGSSSPVLLGLEEGDEAVLMQSTGLKDKNGKEIFEGDITRFCYAAGDKWQDIGVVRWYQNGCRLSNSEEGDHSSLYEHCQDDLEVIGNIYLNPELLNHGTAS